MFLQLATVVLYTRRRESATHVHIKGIICREDISLVLSIISSLCKVHEQELE
jgi:hypothetical protein